MQEKFSARLSEALYIRRIKPSELARRLGIDKSLISQYMSGKCEPRADRFIKIADELKVNRGWLAGEDAPIDPESESHKQLREQIKQRLLLATENELVKINAYIDDIGVKKSN